MAFLQPPRGTLGPYHFFKPVRQRELDAGRLCGRVVGPKERVHAERAPRGATVHGVDDAADAEAESEAEP